jgi:hypothetical protein
MRSFVALLLLVSLLLLPCVGCGGPKQTLPPEDESADPAGAAAEALGEPSEGGPGGAAPGGGGTATE